MKLKFVGARDRSGTPLEYFETVPARDLNEQETKAIKARDPELFRALTRERKTAGGARPALYQEVAPPKQKAATKPKRPSQAKPNPAPVVEDSPGAPEGRSTVETEPAPPANEPAE